MERVSAKKILFIVALIFYLIAGVMLYKGYDKVTNYYNSEYSTANNIARGRSVKSFFGWRM